MLENVGARSVPRAVERLVGTIHVQLAKELEESLIGLNELAANGARHVGQLAWAARPSTSVAQAAQKRCFFARKAPRISEGLEADGAHEAGWDLIGADVGQRGVSLGSHRVCGQVGARETRPTEWRATRQTWPAF